MSQLAPFDDLLLELRIVADNAHALASPTHLHKIADRLEAVYRLDISLLTVYRNSLNAIRKAVIDDSGNGPVTSLHAAIEFNAQLALETPTMDSKEMSNAVICDECKTVLSEDAALYCCDVQLTNRRMVYGAHICRNCETKFSSERDAYGWHLRPLPVQTKTKHQGE